MSSFCVSCGRFRFRWAMPRPPVYISVYFDYGCASLWHIEYPVMKTQQTRRDFLEFAAAAIATPLFQPQASPGRITTLAGTGVEGIAANGDLADHATLNNPFGLVIG